MVMWTSCWELKAFCRINLCTHTQRHAHTVRVSILGRRAAVQGARPHLEVLLQPLPQGVQLVHAPAQVDVAVELDEGSDEVRDAPLCLHLFAAVKTRKQG